MNNGSANVHELHLNHPKIRAEDFRSPLVRRLTGLDKYQDGNKGFENSFRSTADSPLVVTLDLKWVGLKDDHDKCIKTYQVHVLTELASLGLACILLNVNTKKEITEVTRRGDKADYWVGERESLIEISGQQEGDIDSLCTVKSTQLLQNPFGKSGYVCVANYDENKARLWYYENN